MEFISGEDRSQTILLPDCIDEYISENNPVRVIEAYINSLNLSDLGFSHTEPAATGRPMYDPKDMLKLYLYGYMNRIRTSRRLETESQRNVELMWLLRKLSPDHKTIARFRQENTQGLKNVFRDFVKLCVKLNLYGKELVALDGSKFKADNSKARNFSDKKLRDKLERIEARIEEYLRELESADRQECPESGEKSREEISRIIKQLNQRKDQYQGYAQELKSSGETQKSLTDPESRLMLSHGKMEVSYNVQTAVDAKHKLITEFDVINQRNDVNQITPMTQRVQDILEKKEVTLVADAGYQSVQDIVAARELGAEVHVAGTDFDICAPTDSAEETEISSQQNGRCVYYGERNIALCPMGKVLYPGFYKKSTGVGVFTNRKACKDCGCRCTKEVRGRRYQHPMAETDFSKDYDEKNLSVKQIRIRADKEIVKQRKTIVEHPFGTVKRNMDGEYCLTRGLRNVLGEFSLTFFAYNFKRVINIFGVPKLLESIAGQ